MERTVGWSYAGRCDSANFFLSVLYARLHGGCILFFFNLLSVVDIVCPFVRSNLHILGRSFNRQWDHFLFWDCYSPWSLRSCLPEGLHHLGQHNRLGTAHRAFSTYASDVGGYLTFARQGARQFSLLSGLT